MRDAWRIYIAGPYSADSEEQILRNVDEAIDAALLLFKKGHYPYVPHLTHYIDIRAKLVGQHLDWDDFIDWDMAWLRLCDALLVLADSRGARIELEAAAALGKRIFHSLDDIPDAANGARLSRRQSSG